MQMYGSSAFGKNIWKRFKDFHLETIEMSVRLQTFLMVLNVAKRCHLDVFGKIPNWGQGFYILGHVYSF